MTSHSDRPAAAPAPEGLAGWLPIGTAPKDGTELLLTNGKWRRTGYWARMIECWSVDTAVPLESPTHWCYLPCARPALSDETLRELAERVTRKVPLAMGEGWGHASHCNYQTFETDYCNCGLSDAMALARAVLARQQEGK